MTNDPADHERSTDRWLEPGAFNIQVIYYLYLAGLVVGITGLAGIIIAYINRGKSESWIESHYTWLIRTFWIGLAYAFGSMLLMVIGIGFLLILATTIWFVVRCVVGLQALGRREPVKNPMSWMI
ncbi:MAG: hypothetical protein WAT78_02010 [Rhizobiaceae bacterium]